MLEHHGLILCGPQTSAKAGGGARRPVLDAATGEPLGFVRERAAGRRWLTWFARRVLEVCETEDASLLLTLHGPTLWKRAWLVLDAEEHHVGTIHPTLLLDRHDDCLALVQRCRAEPGLRFLAPTGVDLAALTPCAEGGQLAFGAAAEGNPFARMILLGAALVLGD